MPQRPYVPIGSLRRAATYPEAAESCSHEEIAAAFERVGLGHLTDRIDEEGPWDQTLSGGEKQRLAFARIVLHNPDIIVLDEATAALDPQSQDKLMELLVRQPEQTTLISVGHPSRAAAVRELLKRGLAAEGFAIAKNGSRSKDYGVVGEAPKAGAKKAR